MMKHIDAFFHIVRGVGGPVLPAPLMLRAAWVFGLVCLAAALFVAPDTMPLVLALAGFGGLAIVAVWRRPEFGLLALVFLTSSFIHVDSFDLRLPIGGLDLRDMCLLGMIGLLGVQSLMRGRLPTLPWPAVSVPLLVFTAVGVLSALYAFLIAGVEARWVFSEFRSVIYYSAFFIAAWAIERRTQLVTVLAALFLLTDITVTILILQQFLGTQSPLLSAMGVNNWKVWDTEGATAGFGAVRIIPPGHVMMYMVGLIPFGLMVYARQDRRLRLFAAFQFVYITFGLVLTYTRAQWAASGIALALLMLTIPSSDKGRLFKYVAAVVVAIAIGYNLFRTEVDTALAEAPLFNALFARAVTIATPAETQNSFSLQWRTFEYNEAMASIRRHPYIGVGLGNIYRARTIFQGWDSDRFQRYLHNSHLYVPVKMGLIGYGALLWFFGGLVFLGWRAYRTMRDEQLRRITLAVVAGFVGLLVWSYFHSHLLLEESTVVVGLMTGLIASMRSIDRRATGANRAGRKASSYQRDGQDAGARS